MSIFTKLRRIFDYRHGWRGFPLIANDREVQLTGPVRYDLDDADQFDSNDCLLYSVVWAGLMEYPDWLRNLPGAPSIDDYVDTIRTRWFGGWSRKALDALEVRKHVLTDPEFPFRVVGLVNGRGALQELLERRPVICGMSWPQFGPQAEQFGNDPALILIPQERPDALPRTHGWHAVVLNGRRYDNEFGWLISAANWNGTRWGVNGHCHILEHQLATPHLKLMAIRSKQS